MEKKIFNKENLEALKNTLKKAGKIAIDKNFMTHFSLEKVLGTRELWFSKGVTSGLLITYAVYANKYKTLIRIYTALVLLKELLTIADLNTEEAKFGEQLITRLNKVIPPTGTVPPKKGTYN